MFIVCPYSHMQFFAIIFHKFTDTTTMTKPLRASLKVTKAAKIDRYIKNLKNSLLVSIPGQFQLIHLGADIVL